MIKKDLVFKKLLSIVSMAEGFIGDHLPEDIQVKLDFSTLKSLKTDFIENDLKEYFADVLLSCNYKDSDEQVFIPLIENQDRNDPLLPLRLMRYTCQVLEHYVQEYDLKGKGEKTALGRLPVVFPIIFYTGQGETSNDVYRLFTHPGIAKQYTFQPAKVISVSKYTRDQLLALSPKTLYITEMFIFDKDGNNGLWQLLSEQHDPELLDRIKMAVDSNILENSVQYLIDVANVSDTEVIKVLSDRLPENKEQVSVAWKAWYNREGWKIERNAKLKATAEAKLKTKADDIIRLSNKLSKTLEEAADLLDADSDALSLAQSIVTQPSN